jgi:hypothetical protein
VGTLDRFQYYLIASGIPAGREKTLGAVKFDAYRALRSDTAKFALLRLGCVWSPVQIRPPRATYNSLKSFILTRFPGALRQARIRPKNAPSETYLKRMTAI